MMKVAHEPSDTLRRHHVVINARSCWSRTITLLVIFICRAQVSKTGIENVGMRITQSTDDHCESAFSIPAPPK